MLRIFILYPRNVKMQDVVKEIPVSLAGFKAPMFVVLLQK